LTVSAIGPYRRRSLWPAGPHLTPGAAFRPVDPPL